MKERITQLRKTLKLSQSDFGEKIGLTASGVSNIENGIREIQERHVKLILAAFPDVSEAWLRYGTGDMLRKRDGDVARLVERYQFGDMVKKLLTVYEQLDDERQAAVLEYARRVIADVLEDIRMDEEIDAQVEAYRRKLIEEKNAAPASSSSEETA